MKMYKCPDCGRTSTSTYCDTCGKTIPERYAVYGGTTAENPSVTLSGTTATVELLEKIHATEYRNCYLLGRIEKHTKVMSIIMTITASVSLALGILYLISYLNAVL